MNAITNLGGNVAYLGLGLLQLALNVAFSPIGVLGGILLAGVLLLG